MHNYATARVITGIPKLKLTGQVLIYILKLKNLPFNFFVMSDPLYKVQKFWTFATEGKFPLSVYKLRIEFLTVKSFEVGKATLLSELSNRAVKNTGTR